MTDAAEEEALERWELDFSLARDGVANLKRLGAPVSRQTMAEHESRIAKLKQELIQFDNNTPLVATAGGRTKKKWKKLSGLVQRLAELNVVEEEERGAITANERPPSPMAEEQALLQEQNEIMLRQDVALEGVSRSIYRLTGVAEEIGQTAAMQVRLLDEMDAEADGVHAQVRTDTRKVQQVMAASEDTRKLHCIILALCLLFLLLLIIK